jgi:hypothetical protein
MKCSSSTPRDYSTPRWDAAPGLMGEIPLEKEAHLPFSADMGANASNGVQNVSWEAAELAVDSVEGKYYHGKCVLFRALLASYTSVGVPSSAI